jgi:hypothetical protein
MANRDFASNIAVGVSVAPDGNRTSSVTGSSVDLQGADSAAAVVHFGSITDGTFTPKLQESDSSGSGFSDVASSDLAQSFSDATSSESDTTQEVSYIGNKRYIRVVVSATGTSTGGKLSAVVAKSDLSREPEGSTVDSSSLVG